MALYTPLVDWKQSKCTNFLSFPGIPERFWRIPSQDVHHSRYIKIIKVYTLFERCLGKQERKFLIMCSILHLPGSWTISTRKTKKSVDLKVENKSCCLKEWFCSCIHLKVGSTVASRLVCSSSDCLVRFRALAMDIVSCSRHFSHSASLCLDV